MTPLRRLEARHRYRHSLIPVQDRNRACRRSAGKSVSYGAEPPSPLILASTDAPRTDDSNRPFTLDLARDVDLGVHVLFGDALQSALAEPALGVRLTRWCFVACPNDQ